MTALTLYDYLPSGNGYKVRLVLKQLGIPYRLVETDIKQGLTRTPEFLARNPNGRIPLLQIEGQGYLSESHAIIWYLAEGSRLVPADRLQRARLWQWLSFEQYNLEPNVGTVRFRPHSLGKTPAESARNSQIRWTRAIRHSMSWKEAWQIANSWSGTTIRSPISASTRIRT